MAWLALQCESHTTTAPMLIDFSVQNFRAFRDEQTLTLVAAPRDHQHESTHLVTDTPDGTTLLRTVLLYGANASGKTTLIRAADALRWVVLRGRQFDEDTVLKPLQPFRFDATLAEAPCAFAVTFVASGVIYEYALSATSRRVVGESLHYFPEGQSRKLFERERDVIVLGKSLSRATAKTAREITQRRSNTPFLSILGQNEEPRAIEAYRWFKDTLAVTASPMPPVTTMELMDEDPAARAWILEFVQMADLGIRDITVRKDVAPLNDRVRELLAELGVSQGRDVKEINELSTRFHHGADPSVEFEEDDESLGTLRLFALAGALYKVWRDGRVLFIDELASSLHPDLAGVIVRLFNSPSFNRRGAQLIANTHDVTQLDLGRLRRDNVWFTEKASDGSASLLALADVEGVRNDTALMKNYLQGRFGALPAHGMSLLPSPVVGNPLSTSELSDAPHS